MENSKCTFYNLICNYNIEVPIVQRDYAQGRKNDKSKEVRKNLLKAIVTSLSNMQELDFNFVYGNEEVEDNKNVFYPVDGQQRLTTLYLLHWYLATYIGDEKAIEYNSKKRFTYKTRNSASDFFSLLRSSNEGLHRIIRSNVNSIRKEIENQPWFQAEWNSDPTVDSALTMLDTFHMDNNVKNNASLYYERLISIECPIMFSMIKEKGNEGEKLAAKAYIRMNARGRSLEPFENLKAMIDAIDNNNEEKIITNYDTKYIDMLFKNAKGNILEKTKLINEKSFNCFKNIYNIMQRVLGQESLVCVKDSDYISIIYEISKNLDQRDNMNIYIPMLNTYLEYCFDNYYNDQSIVQSLVYEKSLDGFAIVDEPTRRAMAEVIYIYFYRCKKGTIPTVEVVNLYNYVLNNLNFTMWEQYSLLIYTFADEVSKYQDIYYCLISAQDAIEGILKNVGLLDIYVRIKEQKIKAEIIIENGIGDKYYFSKYEKKAKGRKIQYLLYITGYWCEVGNFHLLNKYLLLADKWFMNIDNDLNWRKYYAIAANCERKSGKFILKSSDVINKECSSNIHIWNNDYYYWDDQDNIQNRISIEIVKLTYEYVDTINQLISNVLLDVAYNSCWLKYAVKYNHVNLLNTKLKLLDDGSLILNEYMYTRQVKKYMLYVLELEKMAKRGLYDFCRIVSSTHRFREQKSYYGKMGNEFRYDFSAYNMTLKKVVKIKDINSIPTDEENCVYILNSNIYTVYHYNASKPSCFDVYKIGLQTEIQTMNTKYEEEKIIMDSYSLEECVDFMYDSNNWRKQSGNSRTWIGAGIDISCQTIAEKGTYSI